MKINGNNNVWKRTHPSASCFLRVQILASCEASIKLSRKGLLSPFSWKESWGSEKLSAWAIQEALREPQLPRLHRWSCEIFHFPLPHSDVLLLMASITMRMTTLWHELVFPMSRFHGQEGFPHWRERGSSRVELDGVAEWDQNLSFLTLPSEGTGRQEKGVRPGCLHC